MEDAKKPAAANKPAGAEKSAAAEKPGGAELPARYEKVLRALPMWLLYEYLLELGGSRRQDGSVQGPGWNARLEQIEDFQVGSVIVGQVRLVVEAESAAWRALQPALEKKLLRAGG